VPDNRMEYELKGMWKKVLMNCWPIIRQETKTPAVRQITVKFCVLLTVHLGIILVNDQLDAQFFFSYMFIPNLYMFRALMCSSSGELIVSIRHLVYVTYIQ